MKTHVVTVTLLLLLAVAVAATGEAEGDQNGQVAQEQVQEEKAEETEAGSEDDKKGKRIRLFEVSDFGAKEIAVGVGLGAVTGAAVLFTPLGVTVATTLGSYGLLGYMGPGTAAYVIAEKLVSASVVTGVGITSASLVTSRVVDRVVGGARYHAPPPKQPPPEVRTVVKEVRVPVEVPVEVPIEIEVPVEIIVNNTCAPPMPPSTPPPVPITLNPPRPPLPADAKHTEQTIALLALGCTLMLIYLLACIVRCVTRYRHPVVSEAVGTDEPIDDFLKEATNLQKVPYREPRQLVTVSASRLIQDIRTALSEIIMQQPARPADTTGIMALMKEENALLATKLSTLEESLASVAKGHITQDDVKQMVSQSTAQTHKKLDTLGLPSLVEMKAMLEHMKKMVGEQKAHEEKTLVTVKESLGSSAQEIKVLLKDLEGMISTSGPASNVTLEAVDSIVNDALGKQAPSIDLGCLREQMQQIQELVNVPRTDALTKDSIAAIMKEALSETQQQLASLSKEVQELRSRDTTKTTEASERLTAEMVTDIVTSVVTGKVTEVKQAIEGIDKKLDDTEVLTADAVQGIVAAVVGEKIDALGKELNNSTTEEALAGVRQAVEEMSKQLAEPCSKEDIESIVKEALVEKAGNGDVLAEVREAVESVKADSSQALTADAVREIVTHVVNARVDALSTELSSTATEEALAEVKQAIKGIDKKLDDTEVLTADAVQGIVAAVVGEKVDALGKELNSSTTEEALAGVREAVEEMGRKVGEPLTAIVVTDIVKEAMAETHERLASLGKELQGPRDDEVLAEVRQAVEEMSKKVDTGNALTPEVVKEIVNTVSEKVAVIGDAVDALVQKTEAGEAFAGVPVEDVVQRATTGVKVGGMSEVQETLEEMKSMMLTEAAIASAVARAVGESSRLATIAEEVKSIRNELSESLESINAQQGDGRRDITAELDGLGDRISEVIQNMIIGNNDEIIKDIKNLVKEGTNNIYKSPRSEPIVLPAEQVTPGRRGSAPVGTPRSPVSPLDVSTQSVSFLPSRSELRGEDILRALQEEGVVVREDSLVSLNIKNIVKAVDEIRKQLATLDRGKLLPSEVAKLSEVSKSNEKLQKSVDKLSEKVEYFSSSEVALSLPYPSVRSVSEPDTSPAVCFSPTPLPAEERRPPHTPAFRSPSVPPLKLNSLERPLRLYYFNKLLRFAENKYFQRLLDERRTTHRECIKKCLPEVEEHSRNLLLSRRFRKLVSYACMRKEGAGRRGWEESMGEMRSEIEEKLAAMEKRLVRQLQTVVVSVGDKEISYRDYRQSTGDYADGERVHKDIDITPCPMQNFVNITTDPYEPTPHTPRDYDDDDRHSVHSSRSRRSSILSYTDEEIDDICAKIDKNGNGWIDSKELREALTIREIKDLFEMKGVGDGPDIYVAERVWQKLQQGGYTDSRCISLEGFKEWVKGVTIGQFLEQEDN